MCEMVPVEECEDVYKEIPFLVDDEECEDIPRLQCTEVTTQFTRAVNKPSRISHCPDKVPTSVSLF